MKHIFKYLAGACLAGFAAAACSPEKFEGADGSIPTITGYENNFTVTVDQETNTAYFEFTSAPGLTPYWILDGETTSGAFSFSKYWRKKGDHTVKCYVKNKNGISDGFIEKEFSIERTKMNGFGGFAVGSEHNLMNDAAFDNNTFWFANASWTQIDNPGLTIGADGKSYTLNIATCGPDRWQGQFAVNKTGVKIEEGKTYDFSCIITASNAITGNGVKIKLCNDAEGDSPVLMDKDYKIKEANEPQCVFATELAGADIPNLKIVFDFGGTPDNTEVIIEDFVLIETQYNEIEAPAEQAVPFDYNDSRNVWKQFDESGDVTETSWFGDAGWADLGVSLAAERNGSHYVITIPATTPNEQWHAQYALHPAGLPVSAADIYDISVCVKTSRELPGMTLKITEDGDDNNYFMADRVGFKNEYVWRYEGVQLVNHAGDSKDAASVAVVMDFGGAEEGTEIDIYDITIIKR